jgi:hypothetical protein
MPPISLPGVRKHDDDAGGDGVAASERERRRHDADRAAAQRVSTSNVQPFRAALRGATTSSTKRRWTGCAR